MSAVRIRTSRSVSAITSMPSIPSVPLISARPSLATSSIGARPAAASAWAAGIRTPSASCTSPSPISASAQCESGARSPEQPSEPYSWTTGVIPAFRTADDQLRQLRPYAGPPGRQRREAQQHQPAHHLALDHRTGPGGVRADQRPLQLGAHLGRDVPGRERAEAGRDPVRRGGRGRELVDDGTGPLDGGAASSVSCTGAPSRATATTSWKESGPTPTATGEPCACMASCNLVTAGPARGGRRLQSRIRDRLPSWHHVTGHRGGQRGGEGTMRTSRTLPRLSRPGLCGPDWCAAGPVVVLVGAGVRPARAEVEEGRGTVDSVGLALGVSLESDDESVGQAERAPRAGEAQRQGAQAQGAPALPRPGRGRRRQLAAVPQGHGHPAEAHPGPADAATLREVRDPRSDQRSRRSPQPLPGQPGAVGEGAVA